MSYIFDRYERLVQIGLLEDAGQEVDPYMYPVAEEDMEEFEGLPEEDDGREDDDPSWGVEDERHDDDDPAGEEPEGDDSDFQEGETLNDPDLLLNPHRADYEIRFA